VEFSVGASFSLSTLSATQADTPGAWGPVLILLALAVVFAVGTIALSSLVGRRRTGAVKDMPYESGIEPVGDARRRFNVRFFVIAMIFLLFDVEAVLLFPWATIFGGAGGRSHDLVLLVEMFVFVAILLVGYVYAWRRGVLRFD
jgi:NADH-quinone oxidoreductase subunit A